MSTARRMSQYLERYALPGSRRIAQWVTDAARVQVRSATPFARTLCVPMFDESAEFFDRLCKHPGTDGTLLIACINAPESATPEQLAATRQLLHHARSLGSALGSTPHLWLRRISTTDGVMHVLVLDHCSEGRCLPTQEGVGRARRIAADVALALHADHQIESRWMFQTDADATLSDNYFAIPSSFNECTAVHADFTHRASGQTSLAQRLYDLTLDYYVVGLASAESPYAHYSLGSALAIDSGAYAAVRGYPRRSAGEDFYILNKLAKLGRVAFDPSRHTELEERQSTRVPFGTGPGVRKFSELTTPLEAPLFYAPACFNALGQWLQFVNVTLSSDAQVTDTRSAFGTFVSPETSAVVIDALEQLKLFDWLEQMRDRYGARQHTVRQARHMATVGMDALKTLRLVHALRDCGYPNVGAKEAVAWLIKAQRNVDRSGLRSISTEWVTTTQSLP